MKVNKINGFIIEGADQQGKTMLCNYIQKKIGWRIQHFGPPAKDFNFFDDYIPKNHTICDRSYLTEIAYSIMKGKKSRVIKRNKLEKVLHDKGFVIIILDRQSMHELKNRPELYTFAQIKDVVKSYKKIYKTISLEKYYINPQSVAASAMIDSLIERT